jgi:aromatase
MTPQPGHHEVEHEILVRAPADEVYRLLAEVVNWPRIFPPTVHADRLEGDGRQERIQIWATANGEPKTWTSRRALDPQARWISFRQEVCAPPVSDMGGAWLIEPQPGGTSRIRLQHDYRAIGDDPDGLDWIDRAVDSNSRTELAALKTTIESALVAADELRLSFVDALRVEGSPRDLYDFINRADLWRERLPHVARAELREQTPGLQVLEMDTRTKDGSTHTTKSVRVCFPHDRIVYKQVTLPMLMMLHTGEWRFEPDKDGSVLASSQHTVVINPDNIATVLGPDADVTRAREFVRDALGGNSRATLRLAKSYTESRP